MEDTAVPIRTGNQEPVRPTCAHMVSYILFVETKKPDIGTSWKTLKGEFELHRRVWKRVTRAFKSLLASTRACPIYHKEDN